MPISEIIERVKEYLKVIRKRWLSWTILGLIGALGFGLFAYFSPNEYRTYATFHPDTGNQSGLSAAANPLAFIFGNDVGDGKSNQMIGVLDSRRLSEMVAADSVMINDTLTLLADIIREQSQPVFSFKSLFQSRKKNPSLKSKIVSAGKKIQSKLKAQATEAGFIKMEFSFYSTEMTGIISHAYIDALQEYYKNQKTEKARKNFDFYTHLSDSVKKEIDKAALKVAKFEDQNKNLVFARKRLTVAEETIKLTNLQEMYKALLINREQARSQLLMDTPIIQILDYPDPPYIPVGKSSLIYTLFGLFLGLILGLVLITRTYWQEDIKMYIQQILANQENGPAEIPPSV